MVSVENNVNVCSMLPSFSKIVLHGRINTGTRWRSNIICVCYAYRSPLLTKLGAVKNYFVASSDPIIIHNMRVCCFTVSGYQNKNPLSTRGIKNRREAPQKLYTDNNTECLNTKKVYLYAFFEENKNANKNPPCSRKCLLKGSF